MSARGLVRAIVALVLVRLVLVVVLLLSPLTSRGGASLAGDIRRFHTIATSDGTPWRDFEVEYPPVTWLAIVTVNGQTTHETTIRTVLSMLLCDLAIAAGLAYGWSRRAAFIYLVVGLLMLTYPFIYLRLDLLSVALAVWGLALVRRGRWKGGGVVLALACFAKLWPLSIFPMLALQRRWRALAVAVGTGVVGGVAWIVAVGTTGIQQVVTFRNSSGWEIESVVGWFVRALGHNQAHVESGAWRVGASAAQWSRPLGVGMVLTVAWIWWRAWRRRDDLRTVEAIAPLAAVAAFLAWPPLLSPQYVCWLLPFTALAVFYGERAMAWLAGAVIGISTLQLYAIREIIWGEEAALAMVLLRNMLLVTLVVVGCVRLARRPAAPPAIAVLGPTPEPEPVARPA
jgi:hypothetical protein